MNCLFFGTPDFAVPSLEALAASRHDVALVVTQPDRPSGRGMRMQRPAVAERAMELGFPVRQPATIRSDEFLQSVRELRADVGVVIAYGKILPKKLLEIPPLGFINVHGSLLPKYRGAAPIQRAIESGEKKTGITIMQLDEEMDHGPLFATSETRIGRDERAPELFRRLAREGAALLVETLDAIERGEIEPVPQDHARATYAPRIEKQEGEVDWSEPARRIYDRFRAFWPWPGVSFVAEGERVKLLEIEPVEGPATARPGTIVEIDGGVVVATGKGALRIVEVQRPGRKATAASDYVRGRRLRKGSTFA
jgi:methionyl-tRNA formyltransferase